MKKHKKNESSLKKLKKRKSDTSQKYLCQTKEKCKRHQNLPKKVFGSRKITFLEQIKSLNKFTASKNYGDSNCAFEYQAMLMFHMTLMTKTVQKLQKYSKKNAKAMKVFEYRFQFCQTFLFSKPSFKQLKKMRNYFKLTKSVTCKHKTE